LTEKPLAIPVRGRMFSSLRVRNYRLFSIGQLISICGTWMQTVAQAYLVLDITHSGTQLGLTMGARYLPLLVLSPWGGLVADRLSKRAVLYATQAGAGLVALLFGVLVAADAITLPTVYVLAVLLGIVNSFDVPTRQSFISELVPLDQLGNAVTLNSVLVNVGRAIGAGVGGSIVGTIGLTWCFDLNAASYAAVLVALLLMRSDEIAAAPPAGRVPRQIRSGLSYVAGKPELLIPLFMIALVGALAWEFPVSLPLFARSAFGKGAATYGAMTAVMGAGALVGGLFGAARPPSGARGLAISAIGWGTAIVAAAVAPDLVVAYIALLFVGYGSVSFNAIAKTSLQLEAAPEMRGRVMALWTISWGGTTPIGGPIIGAIGESWGGRWALLAGGVPTLALGLAVLPVLSRMGERAHQSQPLG
jgi:MFS family permease